jgi:hypothetical protein
MWGQYDQCDMNKPHDWLKRARSNCYSCLTGANVCTDPPIMQYHQYLEYLHPKVWEGNLLSMKAFLMTQVRCLGCCPTAARCSSRRLCRTLAALTAVVTAAVKLTPSIDAALVQPDGLRQQGRVRGQHSSIAACCSKQKLLVSCSALRQCAGQHGSMENRPW